MEYRDDFRNAWQNGASRDVPADANASGGRAAARTAFVDRLAKTLPRLSMTNVPMRVFEVSSPTHMAGSLGLRLRAVLGEACEIAEIDASSVGVLFYGPPAGNGRRCFVDALRALAGEIPLTVRMLDLSSTEISDPADLTGALRRAPEVEMPAPARILAA